MLKVSINSRPWEESLFGKGISQLDFGWMTQGEEYLLSFRINELSNIPKDEITCILNQLESKLKEFPPDIKISKTWRKDLKNALDNPEFIKKIQEINI